MPASSEQHHHHQQQQQYLEAIFDCHSAARREGGRALGLREQFLLSFLSKRGTIMAIIALMPLMPSHYTSMLLISNITPARRPSAKWQPHGPYGGPFGSGLLRVIPNRPNLSGVRNAEDNALLARYVVQCGGVHLSPHAFLGVLRAP